MSRMSQWSETEGDGIPLSPHRAANGMSRPRSQLGAVGLRLRCGVPELPP